MNNITSNHPWASIKVGSEEIKGKSNIKGATYPFFVRGMFKQVEILSKKEFYDNIEKWAEVRGISETSPITQTSKLIEELGEMFTAIRAGDLLEVLDAIGDGNVVSVISMLQIRTRTGKGMTMGEISDIKVDDSLLPKDLDKQLVILGGEMGKVSATILRGDYDAYAVSIANILAILDNIADLIKWEVVAVRGMGNSYDEYINTEYACSLVWDVIKDRKGMVVDEVFIKWDDMTEEQKEEFKKREGAQ